MTVTRINIFKATAGKGEKLLGVLKEVLPAMKSAKGFQSYSILQRQDASDEIVVVETWNSIDDHKAAAGNIAPEDFQRVMALMAGPPSGAYYDAAD